MDKKLPGKLKQPPPSTNQKQDYLNAIGFFTGIIVVLVLIALISRIYWILFIAGAVAFVFVYLFTAVAMGKYRLELQDRCDPYKYYRKLKFYRALSFFVKIDKNQYKAEQAIGLRNMGRFEEAKKLLLSVDLNDASFVELHVLYYNNLCDLSMILKDYEGARAAVESGFAAAEKLTDEVTRTHWTQYLNSNLTSLRSCTGDTEGCEEFFIGHLQQADTEYAKIEARYNLGEYYFITRQYDKAKEHFEYIVQRGNRLFHVEHAKRFLAEIAEIQAPSF